MTKCPMLVTLNTLSKKWTLCIIHTLKNEKMRTFTELSKDLKLNPRTLSTRLSELEEQKIISHNDKAYELTKKGSELITCFKSLDTWAEKYQ